MEGKTSFHFFTGSKKYGHTWHSPGSQTQVLAQAFGDAACRSQEPVSSTATLIKLGKEGLQWDVATPSCSLL